MLYAQLPDGATESAIITATDAAEQPEGCLPLFYTDPPDVPAGRGYYWNARYRVVDGERVEQFWVRDESPPSPRSLSKRKLYNALKSRGLWDGVKQYLEAHDLWDDFALATTLDEDDPLIKEAIGTLEAALSLTDEDVERILAASVAD